MRRTVYGEVAHLRSGFMRPGLKMLFGVLLAVLAGLAAYHLYKPLPAGLSFAGPPRPATGVELLVDYTFVDENGERRSEQRIFDEIFALIAQAEHFVLLDMFLYNGFLGATGPGGRPLSRELTDLLLRRRAENPKLAVYVITDPINTVYGGRVSHDFERLRAAGVVVTETRLGPLRDSNPLYSAFWRLFLQPFGNSENGDLLPNPFGEGRVSLRSYLRLFNFKANHRKVLVADHGGELVGVVTSANPHDGSSAHSNVAVRFQGPAAADLLESEAAVLAFSGGPPLVLPAPLPANPGPGSSGLTVQVVTEGKILDSVLETVNGAAPGDSLQLAMFYLSERRVIRALLAARRRGVEVRVILDPNKDAFGRRKDGVPNRPVAAELHRAGIPVRWYDTHGEQCHVKLVLHTSRDSRASLIQGSANLTRRNLRDLNLETSLVVRGPATAPVFADAGRYFSLAWENPPQRQLTVEYEKYADERTVKYLQYRVMEATGLSTF